MGGVLRGWGCKGMHMHVVLIKREVSCARNRCKIRS